MWLEFGYFLARFSGNNRVDDRIRVDTTNPQPSSSIWRQELVRRAWPPAPRFVNVKRGTIGRFPGGQDRLKQLPGQFGPVGAGIERGIPS
jgi:hypothetical protein